MDEEYRKLLGDIRCSHGQEMSGEPNQNISIHAQIPDVLDTLCSDDMIEMRDVLQKQSLGALENGPLRAARAWPQPKSIVRVSKAKRQLLRPRAGLEPCS